MNVCSWNLTWVKTEVRILITMIKAMLLYLDEIYKLLESGEHLKQASRVKYDSCGLWTTLEEMFAIALGHNVSLVLEQVPVFVQISQYIYLLGKRYL